MHYFPKLLKAALKYAYKTFKAYPSTRTECTFWFNKKHRFCVGHLKMPILAFEAELVFLFSSIFMTEYSINGISKALFPMAIHVLIVNAFCKFFIFLLFDFTK